MGEAAKKTTKRTTTKRPVKKLGAVKQVEVDEATAPDASAAHVPTQPGAAGQLVRAFPKHLHAEMTANAEQLRRGGAEAQKPLEASPPRGRFCIVGEVCTCANRACKLPLLVPGVIIYGFTKKWERYQNGDVMCVACASKVSPTIARAWESKSTQLLKKHGAKSLAAMTKGRTTAESRRGSASDRR